MSTQSASRSIFLFLCFFATHSLIAQEIITSLSENPVLHNMHYQLDKNSITDTLELPFFDDFSTVAVYPDSLKWTDNYVYINNSFGVNPISAGVATFDVFDAQGLLYSYSSQYPFEADRLTSKPINLKYQAKDSIYLSFFYQPQGYGNAPEIADSLILEFFSPLTGRWIKVWSVHGTQLKPFKQVMIPVTQADYLVKGFRFRFKNKASIAGSNDPSSGGNCDQWNIDYIRLARFRNFADTILHDVAFSRPSGPLLLSYSSMPWKHYFIAHSAEIGSTDFYFTNHDNIIRNVTMNFSVMDLIHSNMIDNVYVGVDNYNPGQQVAYQYGFDEPPFPVSYDDSARFEITCRLITDNWDFSGNNTVISTQIFKDYYAYDDGSAENGYGIESETAKLAYRFNSYIDDTLRAVDICFNRTKDNASQQFFHLTVWSAADELPGQIIYQKRNVRPEYAAGFNQFVTYVLDTPVYVSGFFFVGWEQTTADKLNVGFDRNLKAHNRIFYNINGTWQPSAYSSEGSLMIRPRLGKRISSSITTSKDENIIAFPNPCSNYVTIMGYGQIAEYYIYDISGKILMRGSCSNNMVEVSQLHPGIYLLRVINAGHNPKTIKITIVR